MRRLHVALGVALAVVCGGLIGCDSPASSARPTVVLDFSDVAGPDGTLPTLAPPISAEETTRMIDGFSWAALETVPERDALGRPTLWYVNVYIRSPQEMDRLRQFGLHYSMIPLFEEERERWAGQTGVFGFEGDGNGVFAFAFVPGVFVNAVRDTAIGGDELFGPVILREIPAPAAANADGSLSLEYLLDGGFVYGGEAPPLSDAADGAVVAPILDQAAAAVISFIEDTTEEIARFFGEVRRSVDGTARLNITVRVFNSDAFFGGPSTLMRRTWGANARGTTGARFIGEPMPVSFAQIQSHAGGAMYSGRTNAFGNVMISVTRGPQTLCVEMANYAAEVREFVTSMYVCTFSGTVVEALPPRGDAGTPVPDTGTAPSLRVEDHVNIVANGEMNVVMRVVDHHLNVFAQLTDAHEYMGHVMGRAPRRAIVLMGPQADTIADETFAWCNSYQLDPLNFGVSELLEAFIGTDPGASGLSSAFVNSDIVFPDSSFDNPDPFMSDPSRGWPTHSRLVPTHEYGHVVWCDEMYSVDVGDEIMSRGFYLWTSEEPDDQHRYNVEALADTVAMQVLRGANYFTPRRATLLRLTTPGGAPLSGAGAGSAWCWPSAFGVPACGEANVSSSIDLVSGWQQHPGDPIVGVSFAGQVEWIASILEDAFDGGSGGGATPEGLPSFAGASGVPVLLPPPAPPPDPAVLSTPVRANYSIDDEVIALPAGAYHRMFDFWSQSYDVWGTVATASSLARTMHAYGFTSTEICELFALHDLPPTAVGLPDCLRLIDEAALDHEPIVPAGPFGLTVRRRTRFTPRVVELRWSDASVRATEFEIAVTPEGGATGRSRLPYARSATFAASDLIPDTRYTAVVTTFHETVPSPHVETAAFVTFSEPVLGVSIPVRHPGGLTVRWTPPTTPFSGVRVYMTRPFMRLVAETDAATTEVLVSGLSSDVDHEFSVRTLNSAGEESVPTDTVFPGRPLPTTDLYVAPWGADTAGAGTVALPFATVGAALAAARSSGANVVRVASGTFAEAAALSLDMDVTVIGGYAASAGVAWPVDPVGTSRIELASITPDLEPVATDRFNASGLPSRAAVAVRPGVVVTLERLELQYDRGTGVPSACLAVLHAHEAEVTLRNVTLDLAAPTGRCVGSLLVGGVSTTLALEDVTVLGTDGVGTTAATDDFAGVVAGDVARVRVVRSDIAGLRTAPLGRVAHVGGFTTRGATSVTMSEARARAAATVGVLANGESYGASATDTGAFQLDDSVLVSLTGGDVSRALVATDTAIFEVVHSAAIAGNDFVWQTNVPVTFRGAAVGMSGTIGSVRVANNLLVVATGAASAASVAIGAIDMLDITGVDVVGLEMPDELAIVGNVLSAPTFARAGASAALILCGLAGTLHELESGETEADLNTAGVYACGNTLTPEQVSRWAARANVALTELPPNASLCAPACSGGTACRAGTCVVEAAVPWIIQTDPTGRPSAFPGAPSSFTRVVTGAVSLLSLPFSPRPSLRDRGGVLRCPNVSEGAGAWILQPAPSCP